MALVLKDRVKETTATTGTGTVTLAGAASGFQSFAAIGDGNQTYYVISDAATGDWEVGIGTYTASGTTLSRTTVLSSSNSGSLVPFAAGTKDVFVSYPSSRSVYLDTAGSAVTVLDIGTLGTSTANITTANITAGTVSTTPTNNTDIVNKQYADAIASGIHFHEAVDYATAAPLPACTYSNGTGGVGATLTGNVNGALTVDSYTFTSPADNGMRILVKNQASGLENGVYTLTQAGNSSPGAPFILTRATDFNTVGTGVNQIDEGDFFLVTSGTVNQNTAWVQQTPPPITLGTTALVFQQFAAPITYTAGTGLSESPSYTFNIATTGVTAATYGSASSVPVFAVNAQGQLTSVTNTSIAISGAAVSGSISGQAGSVANALTAGTYLTSGGTYDGSVARTFAVDATSANTASKVVARDASGNFSAGTITATLSGSATSATTATNIAGGAANQIPYQTGAGATSFTVAPSASNQVLNWNGSAYTWSAGTISGVPLGSNLNTLTLGTSGTGLSGSTTYNGSGATTFTVTSNATSANTASTIVARDGSGNFSAGTITASLSGAATQVSNAVTFNNGGAGGASGSTFNGSGALTVSYNTVGAPSTTGTNASGTWGISITGNSNNISAYTINQNLGTGDSPTFVGTNLTGNVLQLGSTSVLSKGGTWTEIRDPSGATKFWAGNDASIYMNASNYYIRSNDSSATWVNINSSLLSHSSSLRAPIFYDSDNTAYYLNPASTSNLFGPITVSGPNSGSSPLLNLLPSGNGSFQRGVRMLNSGMVGGDSLMYAVGQADGSKNMGQFYFYYAGSGSNSNRVSMGLHSVDDILNIFGTGNTSFGTTTDSGFRLNISGTGYATSDFRAPIFYDSNNTGYYVDPASTSNLNLLGLNSHLEQGNNLGRPQVNWSAGSFSTGMVIFYLPGTTSNYGMVHMVFDIYEYNSPRVATVVIGGHNWVSAWYNTGCNVVGYTDKSVRLGVKDGRFCVVFGGVGSSWSYGTIVLRKIHNAGFYDNVMDMLGNWSATQTNTESFTSISGDLRGLRTPASFEVDNIGYAYGSFRAPIFYDNDDTARYFNGNGGVNFITGSGNRVTVYSDDSGWHVTNAEGTGVDVRLGAAYGLPGIYVNPNLYLSSESNVIFRIANGERGYMDVSSNLFAYGSMRAPIFYDQNNTGYYVDPNSGSNLVNLTTRNLYFAGVGGNSGANQDSYSIYQEPGSWTHPYPDLVIGYHTGIKIGGYYGYNGTRFYNNNPAGGSEIASIGNGDNNLRSLYDIIAYASDKRLKENIVNIGDALSKVLSLNGVTFDWKETVKDLGFKPDNMHEAGVLAQEVQEVLPEAVEIAPFDYDWHMPNKSKSGQQYLTVKYERLVPLLIEAIKEQQQQIVELQRKVGLS
jgi:hypothetical protein